jgi:hypothetical protein
LGKLWEAFCYKAEKDDRRLRRIGQHLQIDPPESPLREFRDPFAEYNDLHGSPALISPGLVNYTTDNDDDDGSDSVDHDYTEPY